MSEIVRKICLLGDFAVGKTSLVSRYVNNVFSDRYLTTVGVKLDTRLQKISLPSKAEDTVVKLVIWDLAGSSTLSNPARAYIQGAHGFVVVCDGTRRATLSGAMNILASARAQIGDRPAIMLVNKQDLYDSWEIDQDALEVARPLTNSLYATSAKTGANVERAFRAIAELVA